jgi:hypothetical protein
MRLWRKGRPQRRRQQRSRPDNCEHTWRLRGVILGLPGPYVCDVCDRCGALRLHGPEEITGPATRVDDDAAMYLESLARRRSPPHGPPPAPPD